MLIFFCTLKLVQILYNYWLIKKVDPSLCMYNTATWNIYIFLLHFYIEATQWPFIK